MASSFNNFVKGIALVPNATDLNTTAGDVSSNTTSNTLNFHNGTSSSAILTIAHAAQGANKVLSKDFDSTTTQVVDSTTTSKALGVSLSGATASTKTTLAFAQTTNRTLTFPDLTDNIVSRTSTDTLTNKSISGSTNTLSAIANASLTNSSVTYNGVAVALGASGTITANTTNTLTIGTGLSGTSFNGSAPVTIAIDSTVVTLTGIQTLTNKTLTSPTITTASITANSLTMTSGNSLVLTNNSQTVSLAASATASATYTITFPDAAATANTALVYNGTNYVWSTAGGWTNSTSTSLAAAGTIAISTTSGQQKFLVAGASAAVTLSTTPFGSSPPVNGATIRLIGNSNTNTVAITNNDATNGCIINGPCILYKYNVIEFQYDSTLTRYVETFRNF